MKILHFLAAGALLAAAPAFASNLRHDNAVRLPAESAQGSIRYVSGGIGRDEAMAFRRAAREYPLSLEFAIQARPRDEFTADVKVRIRDATGKVVLETTSGGPFLLARLPQGMYDIEATHGGKTFERHVNLIDRKPMHVGFVWPAASEGAS